MDRYVSVNVMLELPSDLFEAAEAVLKARAAFRDLQSMLDAAGLVANVGWERNRAPVAAPTAPVVSRRGRVSAIGWRTPERCALIDAKYETNIRFKELLAQVNALPAQAPAYEEVIRTYALKKGLRRPIVSPSQIQAAHARAMSAAQRLETVGN